MGQNDSKENVSPVGEWTGGRLLGEQLFCLVEDGDQEGDGNEGRYG